MYEKLGKNEEKSSKFTVAKTNQRYHIQDSRSREISQSHGRVNCISSTFLTNPTTMKPAASEAAKSAFPNARYYNLG